jgi:hypothetical protein
MATTLADIVTDCTPELVWKDSSQWATPHPNDLYTSQVKTYHAPELTEYVSFRVSGKDCCQMRLILCKKLCWSDGAVETVYYDMGEFVEPISSSLSQLEDAANKIKEYAAYIIQGLRKYGDLRHCPSYRFMDDVDENFNPIY